MFIAPQGLRTALLGAVLASSCSYAQGAGRPAIESFFSTPKLSNAVLSPDGKMLAITTGGPGKRDGLAVFDIATQRPFPTARFDNLDIGTVHWVNNKRLVFDTTDKQIGARDAEYAPELCRYPPRDRWCQRRPLAWPGARDLRVRAVPARIPRASLPVL